MKLDSESLKKIGLFDRVTRANAKSIFEANETMYFIVEEGQARRAVGPQKANLIRLSKLFNRKIKIVDFSPSRAQFIANICYPAKIKDITEEGDVVTIHGEDTRSKGLMIGVRARNLRAMEDIVREYYPVKEIKVV